MNDGSPSGQTIHCADAVRLGFDCDPMLQALVTLAESDPGLPVTLQTGGMLVTGNVVSGHHFVQHVLADVVGTAKEEVLRANLHDAFGFFLDFYPAETAQADERVPVYIHLENARFFAPGGTQVAPDGKGCYGEEISPEWSDSTSAPSQSRRQLWSMLHRPGRRAPGAVARAKRTGERTAPSSLKELPGPLAGPRGPCYCSPMRRGGVCKGSPWRWRTSRLGPSYSRPLFPRC